MSVIHKNIFKANMQTGHQQLGLWAAFGSATAAEISSASGFDWMLIDGEHGPNDLTTILEQLRAMNGSDCSPVVRPPAADPVLIKQLLELGAQNLLIPMVNTKDEAELMVKSIRYAPQGIRGVGAAIARSGDWGRIPHYMRDAGKEISLTLQIESREALSNLEEIASVEGVDAIFIGPADLSASLGHPDDASDPAVQDAIKAAFTTIRSHGKAAGSLAFDPTLAKKYFSWGASFVAVAGDTDIYVRALAAELKQYK
jgi:2-keto-3-deoxy-L-rhamnonate aldolase RhmA